MNKVPKYVGTRICALALTVLAGAAAHAGSSEAMVASCGRIGTVGRVGSVDRHPVTCSVRVSMRDSDLATQPGAEQAYARLRWAAKKACGSRMTLQFVDSRKQWRECVSTALDNAVTSTGSDRVASIHREATGNHLQPASQLVTTR
jgi:UrcA family protein